MHWTLDDIASTLGADLPDEAAREIVPAALSIDTRTLRPGDLFLAIEGERLDGHDYVTQAFERGAVAAIVRRGSGARGGWLLGVSNTLEALHALAARSRAESSARVVAVTGSNGKTTTREMLAECLDEREHVLRPVGNRNNHIGVPLTLLELTPAHRFAVLEMGMNHPGEIAVLSSLVRPHAAIITNIGRAHVGPVGGLDAVREAKLEIVTGLAKDGPLLVPASDSALVRAARERHPRVVTLGLESGADHRIEKLAPGKGGTYVVRVSRQPELELAAPGRGVALAAAAALVMTSLLGGDPSRSVARLARWQPIPGRLAVRRALGYTLLDDTYNASPESMALALETLREVAASGRSVAILGDMLELGEQSKAAHREIANHLGGVSLVFLIGNETLETLEAARAQGLSSRVRHVADMGSLLDTLRSELSAGDTVLVKASHGMRLDRVVAALIPDEDGAHVV
jgi:UDP-N-acetylmuramoyl-tripeptide--D-alanyl-D-alanine ligase